MRSRNIKPGYFANERLCDQEPLARILFAGLWCMADREGRLEDRPRRIKALVLPYDDCSITALLDSLTPEFVIRYEIDGQKYIQVVNFLEHQTPHHREKESDIPPPPALPIPGLAQDKPEASPGQAQDKPKAPEQETIAQDKPRARPCLGSQAVPLIPDSGFLIPDSNIDNPLTRLYRKWEEAISLTPAGDVLPRLRELLEWLESQMTRNGVSGDWMSAESIIALEIDELADKLPSKQNIGYLEGMVQGKLKHELEELNHG